MTPAETVARMRAAYEKAPWRRYPWTPEGTTVGRPNWDRLHEALADVGNGIDPEGDEELRQIVSFALDPRRIAEGARAASRERGRAADDAAWEGQGLDLSDVVYSGKNAVERAARGKKVWLYHGTSSKLWPSIQRHGIAPGLAKVDESKTQAAFLTARPSGEASAEFYARRAAHKLGGRPMVLRVLLPFEVLAWDTDDEDIATGNYQFMLDHVPFEAIMERDGKRLAKLKRPPRPARKGDAAGVIVRSRETGHVLLGRRSEHVNDGEVWSIFGGGAEPGEQLVETAARELREETGLAVDSSELRLLQEKPRPGGRTYATFVWEVEGQPRPRLNWEHDAFGWFDPRRPPLPLHPGARADLERLVGR